MFSSLWTIDPMCKLIYENMCDLCCSRKKCKTAPSGYYENEVELSETKMNAVGEAGED